MIQASICAQATILDLVWPSLHNYRAIFPEIVAFALYTRSRGCRGDHMASRSREDWTVGSPTRLEKQLYGVRIRVLRIVNAKEPLALVCTLQLMDTW